MSRVEPPGVACTVCGTRYDVHQESRLCIAHIHKPGRRVRLSMVDPAGNTIAPDEPVLNADARAPMQIRVEAECEFGWHFVGRVPLPLFPPRGEWAPRDPDA